MERWVIDGIDSNNVLWSKCVVSNEILAGVTVVEAHEFDKDGILPCACVVEADKFRAASFARIIRRLQPHRSIVMFPDQPPGTQHLPADADVVYID